MPDENGNLVKRIDMALHFMSLCADLGVTVKFSNVEMDYSVRRDTKTIRTRPIKNTGFYVSGLHELGHLYGQNQTSNDSRLMQEWQAWVWAKEHALTWTDTAERVMKRALTSYCNRQNIQPMPDEFFDWVNVTREGLADAEPVA